jgi:hypothetical protein
MPFKSQAQRRKFAQLLVEGKISNETFEEWNRETGGKHLPERVSVGKKRGAAGKKAKAKKKKATRKRKASRSRRPSRGR